jgi:hypothetical protein
VEALLALDVGEVSAERDFENIIDIVSIVSKKFMI